MIAFIVIVAVLGTMSTTEAANFFCADASKVTAYHEGFDTSKPPPCPVGSTRFQIAKGNTAQQDTLYKSTTVHTNALCPTMSCYVKQDVGLMVPMTGDRVSGERKVIDDSIQAQIDIQNAKNTELTTNDFCNNLTEASITSKIATIKANNEATIAALDSVEAAITAATTVPQLRAAVIAMNDAHQAAEVTLNARYVGAFEKISRCEFAGRR